MQGIRQVDEVLTALGDRSAAQAVATKVNKGSKGTFTYIPWNATARLLTDVFGVFGWSAAIVGSAYHAGVYTVDLDLEVRALGAGGEMLSKRVPGRGVGTVSATQIENPDAHDTAAKAARADALSTAAKMLGDAFGLFLYDKGDPARTSTAPTSTTEEGHVGQGPRPSEKQLVMLVKNGYPAEQVAALDFKDWKATLQALFDGETPAIAPAGKPAARRQATGTEDDFPF